MAVGRRGDDVKTNTDTVGHRFDVLGPQQLQWTAACGATAPQLDARGCRTDDLGGERQRSARRERLLEYQTSHSKTVRGRFQPDTRPWERPIAAINEDLIE